MFQNCNGRFYNAKNPARIWDGIFYLSVKGLNINQADFDRVPPVVDVSVSLVVDVSRVVPVEAPSVVSVVEPVEIPLDVSEVSVVPPVKLPPVAEPPALAVDEV